jgi:hypothetical protein
MMNRWVTMRSELTKDRVQYVLSPSCLRACAGAADAVAHPLHVSRYCACVEHRDDGCWCVWCATAGNDHTSPASAPSLPTASAGGGKSCGKCRRKSLKFKMVSALVSLSRRGGVACVECWAL